MFLIKLYLINFYEGANTMRKKLFKVSLSLCLSIIMLFSATVTAFAQLPKSQLITSGFKNYVKDLPYTTNIPASQNFPDSGMGLELTDGKYDPSTVPTYQNSAYVGFFRAYCAQPYVEIVIDLEKEYDIKEIQSNFLHSGPTGISYPASVDFSVSNTKDNFINIMTFSERPTPQKDNETHKYIASTAQTARYVMVRFEIGYGGDASGEGRYPWTMIDEIEIKDLTGKNVAMGKTYTFTGSCECKDAQHPKPNPAYPDSVPIPAELTNEIKAQTTDIDEAAWQGHFESHGKTRRVVIDFGAGKDSAIGKIAVNFLKNTSTSTVVNLPNSVTYSYSKDNVTYTTIKTTIPTSSLDEEIVPVVWTANSSTEFVDARFIKVEFDINGATFLDEIEVMTPYVGGTGFDPSQMTGYTKLSDQLAYTISPKENFQYPDKANALSDGVFASVESFRQPGWVGNYINDPMVTYTFDLGADKAVSAIGLSTLNMPSAGIGLPDSIDFQVSLDQKTWTTIYKNPKVTSTTNYDGTILLDWKASENLIAGKSGTEVKARYVRIRALTSNPWLFADEIEIWGKSDLTSAVAPDSALQEKEEYLKPSLEATDGIKDLVLTYNQGNTDGIGNWNKEDFTPYLVYQNQEKTITDTMFDGVLFIAINSFYENGACRYFTSTYGEQVPSNKTDWDWYLNKTLDANGDMAALNEAAKEASKTLNNPNYKVKVVITVPYPDEKQTDFGTLPGGDHSLNFSTQAQREAALKWYVETAKSKFIAANYSHLDLSGFYWLSENAEGAGLAKYTADLVHKSDANFAANELKFFWIPYYGVGAIHKWQEMGFDAVAYQPNHYFTGGGGAERIELSAQSAKRYGLGVEMEMGPELVTGSWDGTSAEECYNRYLNYLDGAVQYGYQGANSFRAYYQWVTGIKIMSQTNIETGRRSYDSTYNLIKGTLKLSNRTKPVKPVVVNTTDKSISLQNIADYEYSIDGVNWQSNSKFTGLKNDTKYTFYQRISKTDTHQSTLKSEAVQATTGVYVSPPDPTPSPDTTLNPDPTPSDSVVRDKNSGVSVTSPKSVTITNPRLVSEKYKLTHKILEALKKAAKGYHILEAYDITLYDGDNKITKTVDGKFKVEIPFNGNNLKEYFVINYGDDGSITAIKSEYKDGKIIFETSHFSTYAIAEKKLAVPATGDTSNPSLILLLIASSAVLLTIRKNLIS